MPSSVTSPAVTVTVRLFARYAEVVGRERVDISLPPGATVGDLVTTLRAREQGFSALPVRMLCAVNLVHVLPSHPLRDGDEVAILPPMAGG